MRTPFAVAALLLTLGSAVPAHADIKTAYLEDDHKAWSKFDPFEQVIYMINSTTGFMDASYYVDSMGDKLSAFGRAGYVYVCLKTEVPAAWAACQADVEAFDAAKANAEVDADSAHAREHESSKALIAATKSLVAAQPARVKALLDKDDAYKKMFDIAATARKQEYGSAELRDIVLAMEDAKKTGSRKAIAECEAKVWPQWVKAVSAIPAKNFTLAYKDSESEIFEAHAATIVGTVDGYLAAVAAISCLPPDLAFERVRDALNFWPGYRGPRNGAIVEMRKANLELDQKDAKIYWPSVDRRNFFGNYEVSVTTGRGGQAPVASVKPAGDKIHIVYGEIKAKTTKCVDYQAGKKPSRIASDGRIVYEGTCFKYADVMVSYSAPEPTDDNKRYAAGVKPGVILGFSENSISYVVPSPTAKFPSVVFGAPVK